MALHNPHDSYFVTVFSNVEVAKDFIKAFLKKEVVEELNLSTLEVTSSSFVDKNLGNKFSDLIYKCKVKKKSKDEKTSYRYINIMFEHKSDFDPEKLPFQVGGYEFNGYNLMIKQKKDLGLILPVVVYHGKKRYKKKTVADIISIPNEHFRKYLPNFDYELISISELSEEQILNLQVTGMLRDALMVLRFIWNTKYLLDNFGALFSSAGTYYNTHLGQNFLHESFVYIFDRLNISDEKIARIIIKLPKPLKNTAMSTLERIEMRGRKKATIEHIQNLLKAGVEPDTIATALKVSLDYVNKIKRDLQKRGEL